MRRQFFSLLLAGVLFIPIAHADIVPEPANSEPESSQDTSEESEDTAQASEKKTGCSSTGGLEMGITLFPVVCLGWIVLCRREEE